MQVYAAGMQGMNTAQVAKLAGVHKDTLLRWLRQGLVPEPQRDRRGWRIFSSEDADKVNSVAEHSASYTVDRPAARSLSSLGKIDWDFREAKTTYLTHGIHPYPAKYIPQIPNALIQELSSVGEVVGDIFCGSGTTLVESLTLKRHAVGVDANPLACLITQAKTQRISENDREYLSILIEKANRFAAEISNMGNDSLFKRTAFTSSFARPDHKAVTFWYDAFIVEELAEILHWVETAPTAQAICLGKIAFSAILVSVSKQDSDTRYVRREKKLTQGDAFRKFAFSLKSALNASIEFTDLVEERFSCKIFESSVLDRPKIELLDLVVCSPPYPNAYSYHLYHMTRMVWLGMDQPLFKREEIGSHRKYGKTGPSGATVETFKSEMSTVFAWLQSSLRRGRFACFIIGNSTIKGKLVDNASLISEEAKRHGFTEVLRVSRRMKDTQKAFNPAIGKIKTEELLILENTKGLYA